MTPDDRRVLTEALGIAQRLGALGPAPIADTIVHALAFTQLLTATTGTVLDLGSGGGVPGLVIAMERRDLSLVLVDRRAQRTDLCRRLAARLGLDDRVRVITADVGDLVRDPTCPSFDAVVARGFGPPASTAGAAVPLLLPGGLLVVSEPPTGDRWDADLLSSLDLRLDDEIHSPAHVVSLRYEPLAPA